MDRTKDRALMQSTRAGRHRPSIVWRLISHPDRQPRLSFAERSVNAFNGLLGMVAFIAVLIFIAQVVDAPMANVTGSIDLGVARKLDEFSQIGSSGWILATSFLAMILATLIALSSRRRKHRAGFFLLAVRAGFLCFTVVLAVLLVQALKFLLGRTHPFDMNKWGAFHFSLFSPDAMSASFPSGHATVIFAAATAMALFIPRFQGVFFIIALAVATARLAMGVHFASDVLGGMVLGVALTIALARYFARRRIIFHLVDDRLVRRGEQLARRAVKGLRPASRYQGTRPMGQPNTLE